MIYWVLFLGGQWHEGGLCVLGGGYLIHGSRREIRIPLIHDWSGIDQDVHTDATRGQSMLLGWHQAYGDHVLKVCHPVLWPTYGMLSVLSPRYQTAPPRTSATTTRYSSRAGYLIWPYRIPSASQSGARMADVVSDRMNCAGQSLKALRQGQSCDVLGE